MRHLGTNFLAPRGTVCVVRVTSTVFNQYPIEVGAIFKTYSAVELELRTPCTARRATVRRATTTGRFIKGAATADDASTKTARMDEFERMFSGRRTDRGSTIRSTTCTGETSFLRGSSTGSTFCFLYRCPDGDETFDGIMTAVLGCDRLDKILDGIQLFIKSCRGTANGG
jgi:hypothetical protein